MLLYHNNDYISNTELAIPISNRSFRYGDGLFETMVVFRGQIPFLQQHLNRLYKGIKLLKIVAPSAWNNTFFNNVIQTLLEKNGQLTNAIIRLMVYREGAGKYQPTTNEGGLLIEVYPLQNQQFALNEKGLHIGIFHDLPKPTNHLSTLKHNNCFPSILASIYKTEQQLDDCLLLNDKGTIAEATSSNIFLLRNRQLYTPTAFDGCVHGIMRSIILQLAQQLNVPCVETNINTYDLLTADEIWLTNSIRGIQWVHFFQKKQYTNKMANYFVEKMNEHFIF